MYKRQGGTNALLNPRQTLEEVEILNTLQIQQLQRPVEVIFTEGNIPNIYAETRNDLGITLGYILARDRFFTMDLVRRLGQGRLSEIFGELALEIDQESRGLGMNLITHQLDEGMSMNVRGYFESICIGINAYIESVRQGQLPPPSEYMLAGPLFRTTAADLMLSLIHI